MLAELLGGWEIVLILAAILILFNAQHLPQLYRMVAGEEEALRSWHGLIEAALVWLAQGLGSGRAPFAPGTFGSLVGLLWVLVLVRTGNFWMYLAGTLLGVAVSVSVCGQAEKLLGQHDPPSVVLDEIVALPICFLPWVGWGWFRLGAMPTVESLFGAKGWYYTLGFFVLFRLFDVVKPWPVRQIQRLPGGWGITADDVLAAVYVALIAWAVVGKATVPR